MGSRSVIPAPANPSAGYQDLPFWYTIQPAAALTALQLGVVASVQIDNDADFEWRWLIANSTGSFSVTLLDKYTSRPLSTVPINNVNLFGTAQLPFILPKPYTLRRNSTMQATLNDTSNAGNTIQLCLVGYKVNS